MAVFDKLSNPAIGILGVIVSIAAQLLREMYGAIGSAAGLALLVAFACVAMPRLRGPVYPSRSALDL